MQLSPLQSRLAASLVASCLLILLYLALFSPHFALAAELNSREPLFLEDHDDDLLSQFNNGRRSSATYEPEFAAFDRSIIGRAAQGATSLINNVPQSMDTVAGSLQFFVFGAASQSGSSGSPSLDLREEHEGLLERNPATGETEDGFVTRRQATRTVFISANTCQQPQRIDPSKTKMDPPQLTAFISTTIQTPGPMGDSSKQVAVEFVQGALMHNLTTTSDVFIGIHAPNLAPVFNGTYNFEISASVNAFYHSFNTQEEEDLIFVDSDYQGALLMTHNLTDGKDEAKSLAMMRTLPYVMFAQDENDPSIRGLKFSFCGLQNNAKLAASQDGKAASMVKTSVTRRGRGNLPKQQFFFSGLNPSTSYEGILATSGTGPTFIGGGGHVSRATNFTTRADHGNCLLIADLEFCNQVGYAVPANPNTFANSTLLAKWYDDYASSMYANFDKVLQQIPCEAPSSQRYSLARNCTDCAAAYRTWLCSVTIPHCKDFQTPDEFLQPRNILQPFPNGDKLDASVFPPTAPFNSSRNPLIDTVVQPGPYKELLPCDDICYNIVQSCPAAMQFSCPTPGMLGFDTSYGQRQNGQETCSYYGPAPIESAGRAAAVPWMGLAFALAVSTSLMLSTTG